MDLHHLPNEIIADIIDLLSHVDKFNFGATCRRYRSLCEDITKRTVTKLFKPYDIIIETKSYSKYLALCTCSDRLKYLNSYILCDYKHREHFYNLYNIDSREFNNIMLYYFYIKYKQIDEWSFIQWIIKNDRINEYDYRYENFGNLSLQLGYAIRYGSSLFFGMLVAKTEIGNMNIAYIESIRGGNLEIVKYVIAHGGEHSRFNRFDTEMVGAAKHGHLHLVKFFQERGHKLNPIKPGVFEHMLKIKAYDVFNYLFDHNIEYINNCIYLFAIDSRRIDIVSRILELDHIDVSAGNSKALKMACENGDIDMIRLLLENKIEVNVGSKTSPIYIALKNQRYDIADLLFSHNAVLVRDDYDRIIKDSDDKMRDYLSNRRIIF